jgi:hypothetical protein
VVTYGYYEPFAIYFDCGYCINQGVCVWSLCDGFKTRQLPGAESAFLISGYQDVVPMNCRGGANCGDVCTRSVGQSLQARNTQQREASVLVSQHDGWLVDGAARGKTVNVTRPAYLC